MDESFLAKYFKSNKIINRATLYISEQIVGFKVVNKSTVDHSFLGFHKQHVNAKGIS